MLRKLTDFILRNIPLAYTILWWILFWSLLKARGFVWYSIIDAIEILAFAIISILTYQTNK